MIKNKHIAVFKQCGLDQQVSEKSADMARHCL